MGPLLAPVQAEAHGDNMPLPRLQPGHRLPQELPVHVRLNGLHHQIALRPQHVGQQQLIAVPVGVQRLVKGQLRLLGGYFAQVHQNLVLNAPAGVGRQLDALGGLVGPHRLDESDGPDGNQVLDIDARILEPAGDVDHQA